MKTVFPFILFLLFFIPCQDLSAQINIYSEAEIEETHLFISANREKLIGNYEKAIELYEKLYQQDRSNAAVCYELARTYDQIGEKEKALGFSEKSVKLDANNQWYAIFNAELLEKNAKFNKAAQQFKALIKLDPLNKYYYIKWAFNEMQAGNADQAILAFNELEKKAGISEDITHRKFNIYVSLGDEKNAIKELLALSNSSPTNTRYLNNLAGYYMNIGKRKDAAKVYKKILKIDPEDATANIALAENSQSIGRDASYLKAIHPVISNPEVNLDVKIKELIPFVEKVNDDPENNVTSEMLQMARELIAFHPNEAKVHALYGDILFNAGDLDEAERAYIKTIKLNKKVYQVWEQLFYTQAELSKYDELLSSASDAINYYPNQASAYYYNALASLKLGKTSDAEELVNECLLISGKNVGIKAVAYRLYAEIKYMEGDYTKAAELCRKTIKINATDFKALEILGDSSFKLNKTEEALQYWKKSKEAGNTSPELSKKIEQKQIIE